MSNRVRALPELGAEQALAADPFANASLSASAGTGKTQVLTARVLRLMLHGASPESILCLTFTKAAAAEMANRIGERLAAWVRMPDKNLRKELFALREPNDPVTMRRARQLFAKVLDCPGGLRIQTIHSFAQALLAAFPAEAGVVPGFEPIEGRAEQELARTTLANLLADAEANGRRSLVDDVQQLSLRLGEVDAVRYLMRCGHSAEAMTGLGSAEEIEPKLRQMMGLPEGSVGDFLSEHCSDERFDCELLRAVARVNRQWGASTGAGHADVIEEWLAQPAVQRAATLDRLAKIVFKSDGDRRKATAGQLKIEPDYDDHADAMADAVAELIHIQNASRLAGEMAAGLRAGQAFAAAYSRAKRAAGVADFTDLIDWTRRLLAEPGMGEWVRYKLDRRTDHILVDESQDTNAAQWEIIQALAEEFFAGAGVLENRHRTIFMVGDFKQAIFRFQGTDPEEFKRARAWVRERSDTLRSALDEDSELVLPDYRELSIDASFRSSQAVLDAVDATIDEIGYPNMGLPEQPNRHRAFFKRPGSVELWSPFAIPNGDEDAGEEGWLGEDARIYAGELAKQVRDWIEDGPVLPSTGQRIAPGDILVLVRSRGELASLIVARLFEEGVPVAGIDRLHLQKPLAVRDLLAAVAFAVQPLDDLNLANLLVSPLVGWSQDELRELAYGRDGKPLWETLRAKSSDFPETRELLGSLLAMADYTTPHRFLETVLTGPIEGRRKLYSRLGLAARDPIDELLSSALEFERTETASLDRFLAWFARGEVEIKRDPSAPANAVRVMTVHGAKGLEAPVVILADSTADPAKAGGTPSSVEMPIHGRQVPVVRPRKAEQASPFAEVIARGEELDLQEHWRLLYVGMTRAIDRLVVAGLDKGERVENCWHLRVERALRSLGAAESEDERWGKALTYSGDVTAAAEKPKISKARVAAPAIPEWAKSPAPPEARPPRPLAPSALAEDREAAPPPSPGMKAAAERGTIIHALLERLPPVAPENRRQAALRWLERAAGMSDEGVREEITGTVCDLISDGRFSPLFGPGSLAEAPIAATLPDGRVIAGTVDRLLVEDRRVVVVDYKTGRAPEREADIPAAHRLQMQAYREALSVIFPERDIESALLYTASGQFFMIGS
ncbi:double-strand break repair helicase AddA [Sphingomonas sp. RG327]|uniref:DNA 3'-5' helicase n=1 Tax=Sphingomonas anseongensis TaxID=2908207 RepID=A0ABT0RDY0_9SPHN|nr:double-strand break repair helicase AddA [Sphingomonas anseongensis]MCL6678467.1 double-strand break repair helicase AddA [Sphingomonas anseongensis]